MPDPLSRNSPDGESEFAELLELFASETIDAAGMGKLNAKLCDDVNHRRLFVDLCLQRHLLPDALAALGECEADDRACSLPSDWSVLEKNRFPIRALCSVAAVLFMGLAIWFLRFRPSVPGVSEQAQQFAKHEQTQPSRPVVARLGRGVDCRWVDPALAPEADAPLVAGEAGARFGPCRDRIPAWRRGDARRPDDLRSRVGTQRGADDRQGNRTLHDTRLPRFHAPFTLGLGC